MRKIGLFLLFLLAAAFPFFAYAQDDDPSVHTRLVLFILIYALGLLITILLLFIIAHKGKDNDA